MMIDDIALTLHPGVGCKTVIHLLACFGSAEAVYAATFDELTERAQLRPALARSINSREYHERAMKEFEFIEGRHIRALSSTSAEYPQRLLETPDYPHMLYISGDIDLNTGHWLSVVGTREMTSYGRRVCEKLVEEVIDLCSDVVIVSGLAAGVDVTAHHTAMRLGVPTVGVLAHALSFIYPKENTGTARSMAREGGAVMSEFHSGCKVERPRFFQRNWVIAGLSDGTLIVESALRGGSLNTANHADGYHRTVMAVPGRVDDPYSAGTNNLIQTLKAQMVCSGVEIMDQLGWSAVPSLKKQVVKDAVMYDVPSGCEGLLTLFNEDLPVSMEELGQRSGISPQELSAQVLELEMAGVIRSTNGSLFTKV